ncbi:hypothetical protein LPB41_01730 [Thalassospira sp. MA62]|nr:hypothetical protein [Thalassospira sp. MA62]
MGEGLANLILLIDGARDLLAPFSIGRFSQMHDVSEKIAKEFDSPAI